MNKEEFKQYIVKQNSKSKNSLLKSYDTFLNDKYDGGDFSFFDGEHVVKKKTGSVVVFTSNFCFPHAVTPVTNGDRHAIITWIR